MLKNAMNKHKFFIMDDKNTTWYATANADTPLQCIFISRSKMERKHSRKRKRMSFLTRKGGKNPTKILREHAILICKCRWKIKRWLATANMAFTMSKPRLTDLVVFYDEVKRQWMTKGWVMASIWTCAKHLMLSCTTSLSLTGEIWIWLMQHLVHKELLD